MTLRPFASFKGRRRSPQMQMMNRGLGVRSGRGNCRCRQTGMPGKRREDSIAGVNQPQTATQEDYHCSGRPCRRRERCAGQWKYAAIKASSIDRSCQLSDRTEIQMAPRHGH